MPRDLAFAIHTFGRERHPVVVVDSALSDPERLVDFACMTRFATPPGGAYPGLNGVLPRQYVEAVAGQMRVLLDDVFGLPRAAAIDLMGYFGLASQVPGALRPIQTVPHIDSVHPDQLAFVHYLFNGDFGGTGFFRHNATGLETVTAEQEAQFRRTVAQELIGRENRSHVHDQTPGYTLIGEVAPQFNRLIVYRSNSLHSGLLRDVLPANPRNGRLTANCFMRLRTVQS